MLEMRHNATTPQLNTDSRFRYVDIIKVILRVQSDLPIAILVFAVFLLHL